MVSISVIAPFATFSRSVNIVFEPSALRMIAFVPVSPRRMLTMSKRYGAPAALSQKVAASAFSDPFSVMRAFAACGKAFASWANSALKYESTNPVRQARSQAVWAKPAGAHVTNNNATAVAPRFTLRNQACAILPPLWDGSESGLYRNLPWLLGLMPAGLSGFGR